MKCLLMRSLGKLVPLLVCLAFTSYAQDGNRLTYLDEADPFYVNLKFPKLSTPQWVGEPGTEAVIILAIDDLKLPAPYTNMLGPILERLKKIDGRAPVSIFCNSIDLQEPQFQQWLREGLSLESHTLNHPCPILGRTRYLNAADRKLIAEKPELAATLGRTNFDGASISYNGCIDLMDLIPGNHAVAFRTPCCDSINSPSPRLFAELINQVSPSGKFLTIDSSVMNIVTPADSSLPKELVRDRDGGEKFRKYLPFPAFNTTVENYGYPYVIGGLTWEFPCVVPSDWEAFHLQGATNAITVADWKSALDVTVLKQGVFTMIFHPHGWIRNDQIVELIDYAVAKYGKKIKFLNFREAQERLDKNLLAGQPLRATNGQDNGVRLLDLNHDGYLDVVIGNEQLRKTRTWNPKTQSWIESEFPIQLVEVAAAGDRQPTGSRFGVLTPNGNAVVLQLNEHQRGAWRFDGTKWLADNSVLQGLEVEGKPVLASVAHRDRGVRLRDVNQDGKDELLVGNESQNAVLSWSEKDKRWEPLPYALPAGTSIVDAEGKDNGLRFVDVNEDGYEDVVFSNAGQYSLHLFIPEFYLGFRAGWSRMVMSGKRGDPGEIPMIVRDGEHRNNGAWFKDHTLWVQNEDTAAMPDLVDRRTFKDMLAGGLTPPRSPKDSLAAIRVRPGFTVELVAAEPLVRGPVAFEWGAEGKLWVVQMNDYPLGLDGQGKPGGTVLCLEDTHGDGHYDKSTVFMTGVNFPNGILPWGKGVLISAPPDILYAEDTDGDGKADRVEKLFSGFNEGNQQHRANGYDYGLDNWLYGANGDSGGRVRSAKTGKVLDISGRDFRFRPATGAFETQAGQSQYGRHRDDWGNWFGNENAQGAWHYFLPEQYLARNPQLSVHTSKQIMPNYPDYGRVFPASRLAQRFNDPQGANHLTSANSPMPYRDELFGPDFTTSYFVSEPVHNLVHREIMEPDGISFTSRRADDEQAIEFFASADNWSRPTMTKTGPDGALYIADMYRQIIEHPEWIPLDTQKVIDVRAGAELGRIYRVFPTNAVLRPTPRLDRLDTSGLVAAMEHPNGWQRDTVQRLLIERADKSAPPLLTKLLATSPHPKTRLQALCTLDGLGAISLGVLSAALHDAHPAVREHAIRISESMANQSEPLLETLLSLVNDPSVRVRYQLAFTLGEWANPKAGAALGRLARNNADQPHLITAVLSSASHQLAGIIGGFAEAGKNLPGDFLERVISMAVAFNDQPALAAALALLVPEDASKAEVRHFSPYAGLLDTLENRREDLNQLLAHSEPGLRAAILRLNVLYSLARLTATNSAAAEPDRLAAVRLLGRGDKLEPLDLQELGDLLGPKNSQNIQSAALAALSRIRGFQSVEIMVSAWKNWEPAMRDKIVESMVDRPDLLVHLLEAIEKGAIPAQGISASQRQRLITHSRTEIRVRAKKLLGVIKSDRQAVLLRYREVETIKGDTTRGAEIFRQNCLPCHRLKNEGNLVGPDLASVAAKPTDYLLAAILDPNQSVEARYTAYSLTTRNDLEYNGIVAGESANSITLRLAGARDVVVLRSDISEMTSTGKSLMPDGFENTISSQAMADLIEYIHSAMK